MEDVTLNHELRVQAGEVAKKIVKQFVDDNTDINSNEYKVATIGALVAGITMLKGTDHPVEKSVGLLLEIFSNIFGGTMVVHKDNPFPKSEVLH